MTQVLEEETAYVDIERQGNNAHTVLRYSAELMIKFGGAVVWASYWRSIARGFDYWPVSCQVSTLHKLFTHTHTHVCLCHRTQGRARIFGLGGRPCRVEPDPARTEVAKPMRGIWVLPQKNFADPNAWNAFSQHLAPSSIHSTRAAACCVEWP